MMGINELKVGDKIETTGDSTFCINGYFDLDVSDLTWGYKITYVDSDYIILNLLNFPGECPYLLVNCKSIEILE